MVFGWASSRNRMATMGSWPATVGQSLSNIWTQTWNGMADLAEAVDDLICSFDYSYADAAMDTLAMFIFFWIVFLLFSIWLARWIYGKVKARKQAIPQEVPKKPVTEPIDETTRTIVANEAPGALGIVEPPLAKPKVAPLSLSKPPAVPRSGGGVSATPPNRKRLSRMSPGPEVQQPRRGGGVTPPGCVGADQTAARWATSTFAWLYSDLVVVNDLLQLWILAMNEYSKKSVEEVSTVTIPVNYNSVSIMTHDGCSLCTSVVSPRLKRHRNVFDISN